MLDSANMPTQGKILAELKSKPVSWRLIVPLLLLDSSLTKAKVQELAGTRLVLDRWRA